jgi:hypothetical protein
MVVEDGKLEVEAVELRLELSSMTKQQISRNVTSGFRSSCETAREDQRLV